MSMLGQIAAMVSSRMGSTVLEGALEGKTAQQITAMLGGALRSSGRAPKTTAESLPKRERSVVERASQTMTNMAKIFPKSEVVQREASKEKRQALEIKQKERGYTKMGRETTDPNALRTFARGGTPPVRRPGLPAKKLPDAMERLGNIFTAVGGKLGVIGKVATVGVAATVATIAFARRQLRLQEPLARFSPQIAQTMAQLQVQRLRLDIRTARATGHSTERLGDAVRGMNEALQPWVEVGTNVKNAAATLGARIVQFGIPVAETSPVPMLLKQFLSGVGREEATQFEKFMQGFVGNQAEPRNLGVGVRAQQHRRGG